VDRKSLVQTLFLHNKCDGGLRYATVSYAKYEMNYVRARLARVVCNGVMARDPTRSWCVGTTNCKASISPSVEDPAPRDDTFDELV
jgi:hypothetical protein